MANGAEPQQPTDQEARLLLPQIERLARQVANRLNASRSVREALAQEAVGHVFTVYRRFDPDIAGFGTWCYAVLRNLCVTLIREEARGRNAREGLRERAELAEERQMREGPPRSPEEERQRRADLVRLLDGHLAPIDRLLLAAYEGFLGDLGVAITTRWCHEATRDDVAGFLAIESLPKDRRKEALANLVGEKHDWVRQRIYRAVQRLKRVTDEDDAP